MTKDQQPRLFSTLDASEKFLLGNQLGTYLLGTVLTVQSALDDGFLINRLIKTDVDPTLDSKFCEGVDSAIMVCETCGWNVASDEVDEHGNCEECQEEATEEE